MTSADEPVLGPPPRDSLNIPEDVIPDLSGLAPQGGLPDSGHRVDYGNGARRESAPGKGRYDLISPIAEDKLAKLLEKGALKYSVWDDDGNLLESGERNWENGLPLHLFVDSCKRHLRMLMMAEGEDYEDHAVAALWNMMALVHTMEMIDRGLLPAELDDLGRERYMRRPMEAEPMREDQL